MSTGAFVEGGLRPASSTVCRALVRDPRMAHVQRTEPSPNPPNADRGCLLRPRTAFDCPRRYHSYDGSRRPRILLRARVLERTRTQGRPPSRYLWPTTWGRIAETIGYPDSRRLVVRPEGIRHARRFEPSATSGRRPFAVRWTERADVMLKSAGFLTLLYDRGGRGNADLEGAGDRSKGDPGRARRLGRRSPCVRDRGGSGLPAQGAPREPGGALPTTEALVAIRGEVPEEAPG